MEMTVFRKTVFYALLTGVLTATGWWLQQSVIAAGDPAAAFTRSLRWLMMISLVLAAGGIPRLRNRNRDALFMTLVGGVFFVSTVVLLLLFGGMEDATAGSARTAVNLLTVLWTALPVLLWLRTLILACSRQEERRSRRITSQIFAWVLAIWTAVLIGTGQVLHLVSAEDADELRTEAIANEDD